MMVLDYLKAFIGPPNVVRLIMNCVKILLQNSFQPTNERLLIESVLFFPLPTKKKKEMLCLLSIS